MSRIGNKKIEVPQGVTVDIKSDLVEVKGPKGSISAPLFEGIAVEIAGSDVTVKRSSDQKDIRAKHGLVRSLVANCITGASVGFTKTLILQGVGYRAQKKGSDLVLTLGYSHEINMNVPSDVTIDVPEPTKVVVSGIDKQRVGQVAAEIRSYRKPEPYKGKGVRYEGEVIRRKAGKAGKK